MKTGFTTGRCSAAAAKAAAYMLLGGNRIRKIRIETPAGIPCEMEIRDVQVREEEVSCAVRKYAGDDPDVTDDALIAASVSVVGDGKGEVFIEGGEGVGTVTRPGLDQPVGNAAINSVPRSMIKKEVKEVMHLMGFTDSLRAVISVPEGRKLAEQTFNPRLGIVGGISIIGTKGIVEPMSKTALLETIRVELRQRRAEGAEIAVVSPGNYGLEFMKRQYDYDLDLAVKCSNFIGDTIDMAGELGFKRMLLVGHIGKLVKVSGGIMNTHSREADSRMELLAAAAVRAHAPEETVLAVLDALTTEEAYRHLADAGIEKKCSAYLMERIAYYLNRRACPELEVQCMVYSNERGLLGKTELAEQWLAETKAGRAP